MTIAAKHFDPQLGIDIHFYGIPLPVATVPLPTPHIGIVFDPFDYVPIIGSTVDVNGIKRATAGTGGLNIHIPVGPYSVEFLPSLPEGPQKEDELFMGSRTVLADGSPFSKTGMPVLDCNIVGMIPPIRLRKPSRPHLSLTLPTAVNLAVASNVFVGGPPTIDLTAMVTRMALGGALKALRKSGLASRAGAAFKKLRQKLFKHLPDGSVLKCKVLRAEPVDIRDGSVSVEHEDFTIPGRLSLTWSRRYSSGDSHDGHCGVGWRTLADLRLLLDADGTAQFVDLQSIALFPSLPEGEGLDHAVRELVDGARLFAQGNHWIVQTREGQRYVFLRMPGNVVALTGESLPIERIEDLCGNDWRFERQDGRLTRIVESGIDNLQGRFIVVQSVHERIAELTLHDPASSQSHLLVRYAYDADGDLLEAIDPLDAARRFEYQRHHLVRHTDRTGLSFHYRYDANWRVVHAWGDGGLYDYRFHYDEYLNETVVTDSLGHTSIIKFDEYRLPICEIDPLDGLTVFEYDELGRTVAVVDPEGLRTAFAYDDHGNLLRLTRPDGSELAMLYDDDRAVSMTDPDGGQWMQAWDAHGLLCTQTSPLGATSHYIWDAHGQLVDHVNARGAISRLRFDRHGALTELVDPLGNTHRFEHDALGRLQIRFDAVGHATRYRYDAKGRLLQMSMPGGAVVRCDYDAEDQLTRYIDEAGAETQLEYCGISQLARRRQPDGRSVRYTYDSEEQLTGVINQRGETYRLVRDPLGRIIEEVDYWGQPRHYHYDAAGRLRRSTDPLGRRIAFDTDKLGRITRKTLPDAHDPLRQTQETFRYSQAGQLVEMRNAVSHVVRRFDAEGRLVHESQNGFAVEHDYDELGNRISRRSDAGNTITVAFDLNNQANRISINDEPPVIIERNALGLVVVEQLSPALRRELHHNDTGLLTAQAVSRNNTPVFDTTYDYDRSGNLVARNDSDFGQDSYVYDPMGRVLEHINPAGKLTRWLNDPAGDRLQTRILEMRMKQRIGGAPVADVWTREGNFDGMHYVFDRAGNLIRRQNYQQQGKPTLHLCWDANQRLAESHWQGGERDGQHTTYGYDPLGRRVFKRNRDDTIWFFWDGDALLAEVAQANADHPDHTREPHTAGNVVDMFAATKRIAALKQLHPQAREYVCKPGTFEPLALIEGKTPTALPAAPTVLAVAPAFDVESSAPTDDSPSGIDTTLPSVLSEAIAAQFSTAGKPLPDATASRGDADITAMKIAAASRATPASLAPISPKGNTDQGTMSGGLGQMGMALGRSASSTAMSAPDGSSSGQENREAFLSARRAHADGVPAPAQESDSPLRDTEIPNHADDREGVPTAEEASSPGGADQTQTATTQEKPSAMVLGSMLGSGDSRPPAPTRPINAAASTPTAVTTGNNAVSKSSLADVALSSATQKAHAPSALSRALPGTGGEATFTTPATTPAVAWYHNDPNGCPVRITDSDGHLLWAASYSAWGAIEKVHTERIANPIRLQGQYVDAESGLHYNRYRYYDAGAGQFIGEDPIRLKGGLNLYGYGRNAINWVDPLGLAPLAGADFTGSPDLFPAGTKQSNIVVIQMQGSRGRDFTEAYKKAGITKSAADGYTWHHVDDFDPATGTTTMQLVKTQTHEASFPHKGSVSQYEKHFKVKYESQDAVDLSHKKGWLKGRAPKTCRC